MLPWHMQDSMGRKLSSLDSTASSADGGIGEPTRVDITASAIPSGHYDPKNDVILRLEAMSASETRVSLLCNICFMCLWLELCLSAAPGLS